MNVLVMGVILVVITAQGRSAPQQPGTSTTNTGIRKECGSYDAVSHIPRIVDTIRNKDRKSGLLKDFGGVASLHNSTTDLGSSTHFCGAVLISDRHLLTAAHCMLDVHMRFITISLGRENLDENPNLSDTYGIQSVTIHHLYDKARRGYNDVGIITTNRKVSYSNKIWPHCLPDSKQVFENYLPVEIAGWGGVNKTHTASFIRMAFIKLVDKSRCEAIWREHDLFDSLTVHYPEGITNQILCAGRLGVGACKGDSGGPMSYQNSAGVYTVIGLVSKGVAACPVFPAIPSLYTNIANYIDWIYDTTRVPGPASLPITNLDQCAEGHTWKQDCNDCIYSNGEIFCTTKACIPTTTGHQTVTAPTGQDMWEAAKDGNLALVNNALAKGTNPNWKNKNYSGRTALHIASQNNHPMIISALLNAGVDKEQRDNNGWTSIFIASSRGSTDSVITLIEEGADVNSQTSEGYTVLMQATGKGYSSIVNALIDAHANVRSSSNQGGTALHEAAFYNRPELARLLLKKGADATKKDKKGRTPADVAREIGYHKLANTINTISGHPTPTNVYVIKPSSVINSHPTATTVHIKQPTTYSEQDLWNAAMEGNLANVNKILTTGTNPNWQKQGYYGNTALHIASENNHPAVVSALLDAGAEKDLQNNYGATPIFVASDRGSTDSIIILITRGANVNIMTSGGYTPLMQATGKGFLSIVEALIGAHANISLLSKEGTTALHLAAGFNRQDLARLLLQKGADPMKRDKDGQTPTDAARERGYHQVANIINKFTCTTGG